YRHHLIRRRANARKDPTVSDNPRGLPPEQAAAQRRKEEAAAGAQRAAERAHQERARRRETQAAMTRRARTALAQASSGERSIHPALIPGIDVENTDAEFKTNKPVFAVALTAAIAALVWAIIARSEERRVGEGC